VPALLPRPSAGACRAVCGDAERIAATIDADVAYLDPPYNQHSYLNNYHIWESLVRWDKPDVYGIACKRIDCRTRKSAFNSRPGILDALNRTIGGLTCPTIVMSFNNEGFLDRVDIEQLLRRRGYLTVIELVHDRYVGAKIGIYNPQGKKVGKVGHLKNTEFLYVVTQEPVKLATGREHDDAQPVLL
jgi:adenine-specific DNA-methyltransferase